MLFYEDLRDVVLVGHSYAGMVIAGLAPLVVERLTSVIYLDAFLPEVRLWKTTWTVHRRR